jgi:hypothetical protein
MTAADIAESKILSMVYLRLVTVSFEIFLVSECQWGSYCSAYSPWLYWSRNRIENWLLT